MRQAPATRPEYVKPCADLPKVVRLARPMTMPINA